MMLTACLENRAEQIINCLILCPNEKLEEKNPTQQSLRNSLSFLLNATQLNFKQHNAK